ncbi:YicC/YloC family endoribonuclease [Histidinibacterium aquaticum]|uniref:YicC family protein n=1 Tax=Histidinibacterium aquaticum TaxID=2613962 RepID=A0A5J5GNP2_9RHOB|nr:YicC/YloC family endoribonuclease [Histidinibacterium aquaticum]KAA9009188.1 YicC family protein [Histidinibacterium aquaticum]
MTMSMTAFASRRGASGPIAWTWEMRGVNARSLDLRLRLPDSVTGLEAAVRPLLSKTLARGSITLTLRLSRDEGASDLALDEAHLGRVLGALARIEDRAAATGHSLAPATAADVLAVRGVVASAGDEAEEEGLQDVLIEDLRALLGDFVAMRETEGRALSRLIEGQLGTIAGLVDRAEEAAEGRREETRAAVSAALARVMEEAAEVDEDRVAQELALIAVKQDVTEEIDRLRAHVEAARALLEEDKPAGRRLDFLAQEFNREANTLCSKSQSKALTAVGLELKAVIEQMREQIQNVE